MMPYSHDKRVFSLSDKGKNINRSMITLTVKKDYIFHSFHTGKLVRGIPVSLAIVGRALFVSTT